MGLSYGAGQVEITDLIVGGAAKPHTFLRVEEEFPHGVFRLRKWILDDIPGLRIEATDYVHVIRRIPNIVIRIYPDGVGRGLGPGQIIILEFASFRIESCNLARREHANPHRAIAIYFQAPRKSARIRDIPLGDLLGLPINFTNPFARLSEPDVTVAVGSNLIGASDLIPIVRELACLRIKPAKRFSAGPDITAWIKCESMLFSSRLDAFLPRKIRILILGDLLSWQDPICRVCSSLAR